MNKMKKEMVDELGRMLMLITAANRHTDHAMSNGYAIEITTSGSFVSLSKFSKDLIDGKGEILTPKHIQVQFDYITQELVRLGKLGFAVDITGRRPNGHDSLYLEGMSIEVSSEDYGHKYYTDK